MKKYMIASVLFFFTHSAFAAPHYLAIIDAGSTHTSLEIFTVEKRDNDSIHIVRVSHDRIEKGISEFSGHTDQLVKNLKPLLKTADQSVPKETPFYLYGTAGMRLLSDSQQSEIYSAIKQLVTQETSFSPNEIRTISGQYEGLFDWIAANDAQHNFDQVNFADHLSNFFGILDMGGASVEAVYPCNATDSRDSIHVDLQGKSFTVCSHSFLGWGQQEAMNESHSPKSCFVNNYPIDQNTKGHFNFKQCQYAIKKTVLTPTRVKNASQLIAKEMTAFHYLALSGFYFTSEFFNLQPPQSFSALDSQIQSVCTTNWQSLKQQHPDIPVKYLKDYCFNAVYQSTIAQMVFHNVFHQTQVEGSKGINWTEGAVYWLAAKSLTPA